MSTTNDYTSKHTLPINFQNIFNEVLQEGTFENHSSILSMYSNNYFLSIGTKNSSLLLSTLHVLNKKNNCTITFVILVRLQAQFSKFIASKN